MCIYKNKSKYKQFVTTTALYILHALSSETLLTQIFQWGNPNMKITLNFYTMMNNISLRKNTGILYTAKHINT